MSRFGGDCYVFAMLAMGFCDVIVESHFHPWDVAALIPIVEGAGGMITDWHGGDPGAGGQCLASGDRRVHEEALKAAGGGMMDGTLNPLWAGTLFGGLRSFAISNDADDLAVTH